MDTELQLVVCPDVLGGADAFARNLHDDPAVAQLGASLGARGFRHWAYSAVPACPLAGDVTPVRVTTYPRAHVEACKAARLYLDCPGLEFARAHTQAADFSTVRAATPVTARLQRLLELNRRFDVTLGLVIPLHNVIGMHAVIAGSFTGSAQQWAERRPALQQEVEVLARAFNRALLHRHARSFAKPLAPTLSQRQQEVVRLLAQGCTTEAAAHSLGISVHTVNKHIASIKNCMGAVSMPQLTAHALQWGLI